jgi:hypothetical protein
MVVSRNDGARVPGYVKNADALVEAWRKGECNLVKQTLDGGGDDRMKIRWKRETLAKLLPTEQDYFKRFIGGLW